MITDEHVAVMKGRLKIFHSFEDKHIKFLLEESYNDIVNKCKPFDMSNTQGASLVYERTRYAYNDALEYFDDNFLHRITSFALDNLEEVDYDKDYVPEIQPSEII